LADIFGFVEQTRTPYTPPMRLFCAILLLPLLAIGATPRIWVPPFYNGVAAQVEESLITYDDLRREMISPGQALRARLTEDSAFESAMAELYQTTLNGLVERALMVAEFKSKGFSIPPRISKASTAASSAKTLRGASAN
jgi:hypothetical protein